MSSTDGPVVFQCKNCRSIVGDSISFVCSDAAARTVTLSAACRVSRGADVVKGAAGEAFHRLFCQICEAEVGRVVVACPRRLDELRDAFTFDTTKLQSHLLGSSEYSSQAGSATPAPAASSSSNGAGVAAASGSASGAAGFASITDVEALQRELTKVQNCLLLLNERVAHLESNGDADGDGEEEEDDDDDEEGDDNDEDRDDNGDDEEQGDEEDDAKEDDGDDRQRPGGGRAAGSGGGGGGGGRRRASGGKRSGAESRRAGRRHHEPSADPSKRPRRS